MLNQTTRRIFEAACTIAALCLPGCERHAFEPGDHVTRKLDRTIHGTVTVRLNLDGKQDTYFIAFREDGNWREDGPVLAEDLELIP